VSPDNPVFLTHASGHAAFANSRALEAGGIGRDTPDPDGGTIVRDASGEATGLLRETAQRRVEDAWRAAAESRSADEREAEFRRQVELAGQDALAKGVTSFHDAGSNFAVIDRLMEMAEAGELPVRLYVMVRGESNENLAAKLAQYRTIGLGNGFLTVRAIKRQLDGALGAHGAWMLEPYADLPQSSGLVLEPVADIEETARLAIQHSYQLNVHAIGDRANREVLDLYERAFNAAGVTGQDVRWRIEHAQHLDVADIPRFAELGVIAAMQGVHATSDGPWVPDRIGAERARTGAYLWRTLLDSGARIVNGTDTPVEDVDPIASFYASVSRRLADGSVFFGAERMTRAEALRSYTLDAAYAGFEEDVKGSITPGKLADLVVLSKDILVVPEDEILTARVDVTILGGKVRYRRSPSSAERAVRVLAPNDNNLQWLTFWVAEGAGYFADESLQVEVTPGGTGDEEGGRRVTQALIDGSADVVIQPRPLFLLAVGEQLPVVAFANLLRNDPINLVVQREIAKAHGLSPESPLADRLEALRGLKIGVAPGPVPRLRVLAAAAGLNPDRDIEIVIVPGETQNESFGNRSVDALYAHTPYLETALSEQDGVLVVNQSAGEVPALADRQIHMLVTTRQFRDANPDVLLRMTRAVYRAQRLIHSDSEATLTAIRASSVRLRAPEALALIVELYAPAVPETPAVSVEGALAEMAFFPGRRAPPDLSGVDMATYVDNSFAAQVQAEH
jgi:predicted amidohydrolase YtcJ/ABC-type nitrate/sulfonate/bicarbonate transport system substrate-binding protein